MLDNEEEPKESGKCQACGKRLIGHPRCEACGICVGPKHTYSACDYDGHKICSGCFEFWERLEKCRRRSIAFEEFRGGRKSHDQDKHY